VYHLAKPDRFDGLGEAQSATSAANGIHIACNASLMYHFQQAVLGDAKALGNLRDCRKLIFLECKVPATSV